MRQKDRTWCCSALCWCQLLHKAGPEVIFIEKTVNWLKARVHSVARGPYMSKGGLEVAQEVIALMKGEHLPSAPRWIKGDTLADMIHKSLANTFVCLSGSIRLLTVTV